MRKLHLKLLVTLSILGFVVVLGGCHKKQPPPPPPPPPAAAPPPAPTVNLTAEPATVEKGHSVTLSWNSDNATSVSISPDVGKVEATGSTSVTPGQSTTYVATATGPGGSATASARVTVSVPPPPPPPPAPKVSSEDIFNSQIKDVYFDFDKSDIRADAQSALTADAEILKANPDIVFTVEGHCDQRGSEEYNLGLGDRRATAVKTFLINLGISANRIFTISYGKDRPFCTESTEACWQSNRRGHLVFGRPGTM